MFGNAAAKNRRSASLAYLITIAFSDNLRNSLKSRILKFLDHKEITGDPIKLLLQCSELVEGIAEQGFADGRAYEQICLSLALYKENGEIPRDE